MSDPLPFSFKPDWTQPITERLSWLTAVMQSRSGAEQREGLRITPRRQFDIPLMMDGLERSYFDTILARNGGGTWNVPIPQEQVSIGPVSASQTSFFFDTSYREIDVGSKLLIRDDWTHSEIVEVASVTADGITTTPTELAYQAASITPTFQGVITDMVTASRQTARIYTATVRFSSLEPTIWPVAGRSISTVPTLEIVSSTFPALTIEPNGINALDYNYERMWSVVDNDTGLRSYTDKAARQFVSQKYEFYLMGAKERSDFRDLLYTLKGRLSPIWVPTFNDDLPVHYGISNPLGLSTTVPPGREFALWFFRDGTVASVPVSVMAGGVPPADFEIDSVYRTSFIDLRRLDVDDIEIQHYTTIEGVATSSVIFKDAPDLRNVDGTGTVIAQTYPQTVYHTAGGDVTPTNDVASTSPTIADLVASQIITAS